MKPTTLLISWLAFCCVAIILGVLTGCSGAKLKRCSDRVEDPSVWSCVENVQGEYWKCEVPTNLWRCQDPN